jgi:hypothetical protein
MGKMKLARNSMRRLILSLLVLLAIVFLAHSQISVHIGGTDGKALLKNMTNSSLNLTGFNNTTSTISIKARLPSKPLLLGTGGKAPLKNLTNSSLNLSGKNNTTSDLSTWGGKPLPPPPPPDFSNYQNVQVVKDNRVE